MTATNSIAIFGGTFDPIHNGHIHLLQGILKFNKFSKVVVVPAGNPWQKSEFTESKHRLEMVKKAVTDLEKVEVLEIEVNKPGPTYTYETLQELHRKYPNSEFILILGSDAVAGLNTWKEPNLVKTLARIYVVQRAGDFTQDWHFDHIQMPPIEISSTEIREKVINNESISELVPKSVFEYISANGLYKN